MPRKLAKPEDQMKRQLIANIQYEAVYGGRVVKACQQIWHTYSEPFQG